MKRSRLILRATRAGAVALISIAVLGCQTHQENRALIGVAGTALGARTPTHEIEQTYYLGIFDPQEQVPPTIYRVRVHGQASFLSFTKFASGWVPASVIDSLGQTVQFAGDDYSVSMKKAGDMPGAPLESRHRFLLFGPEGVREAPKDQRLVIVMGADPSAFFNNVDLALGAASSAATTAEAKQQNENLDKLLFEALAAVKTDRERLEDLSGNVKADMHE